MATMQKIVPNLWFNSNATEAIDHYLTIFKDGKKGRISYYSKEGFEYHGKQAGTVLTIEFEILGQRFIALNGGSEFPFTEAVSFVVYCDTQDEIDYYWDKLSEGGDPKAQVCGWLKDKYGLSWQIVPAIIPELIAGDDQERSDRVMAEVMQMKKLDIARLEAAAKG
jgi:predicted 3-demethylubiquinone-9 3-methyltransferase (glyoxalase superfamily)